MVSSYAGLIKGSKDYMRLYHLLMRQTSFDETVIKREMSISENKLAQLKWYLFDHILDSLLTRQSELSFEDKVNDVFIKGKVLYQKGLFDAAGSNFTKARFLASEGELFRILLLILEYERKVYSKQGKIEELVELEEMFEDTYQKLKNIEEYEHLVWTVNLSSTESLDPRSEESKNGFFEKARTIIERGEEYACTKTSKSMYYSLYRNVYQNKLSAKERLGWCQRRLEILNSSKVFKESRISEYVHTLTLMMPDLRRLKHEKEFIRIVSEIKLNIPSINAMMNRVFSLVTLLEEHVFYFQKGDTARLRTVVADSASLINKKPEYDIERLNLVMKYAVALSSFYLGDIDSSLKWVRMIINQKAVQRNKDILAHSRVLHILLHIEKGNIDVLEYYIKSTYRHLRDRDMVFKGEKIFLDFSKALIKQSESRPDPSHLKILKEELLLLKSDPKETWFFEFIDVLTWVDSKIRGKPIMDVKADNYNS